LRLQRQDRNVLCPLFLLPRNQQSKFQSFLVHCAQVTFLPAVPPMVLALSNSPVFDQYDTSSLKAILSGAAPLPETVGEVVAKRLKLSLCQGGIMSLTTVDGTR